VDGSAVHAVIRTGQSVENASEATGGHAPHRRPRGDTYRPIRRKRERSHL